MDEQLDIEQVKRDIASRANEIVGQAVEFAREKPHAAIGIAFGVGWILGNGLPPRVIGMAARMGWRALLGGAVASGGLMNVIGSLAGQEGGLASSLAGAVGGSSAGNETSSSRGGAVRASAPRSSGGSGSRARSSAPASKE